MGKLLKAGAEARHFLSQFRSLTKMAELLSDLSGLDGEINALEKRKGIAEVALSKLKEEVELVNRQCVEEKENLGSLQIRIKEEKESFDSWMKGAKSSKERIINDTTRLQTALKELRAKLL